MNEELQKLYKSENVSMGGGCLWSLVPLLILFPLISVVREPITYMLGVGEDLLPKIFELMNIESKDPYAQIAAASRFPEFAEQLKTLGVSANVLGGVDFSFLGFNLAQNPEWKVWTDAWSWNWAHIGPFLIPVLSALTQVFSMLIAQRMNNSVITDDKGLEDKDTAKKSQSNQSMKMMMWTMPLISLLIGFGYPAALSLYWLVQGLVSVIIDVILTQRYRKIYDAEDAVRLQLAMEQERMEAEKERIRAERRAANPDGITENTSKKKLQQKQKNEQQAAKAAAARDYAAKRGMPVEEELPTEKKALSGISDRPFCKGRAYDPNRYSAQSTEE
jgi:YidC/Oxa1 family membrane protein insertase